MVKSHIDHLVFFIDKYSQTSKEVNRGVGIISLGLYLLRYRNIGFNIYEDLKRHLLFFGIDFKYSLLLVS